MAVLADNENDYEMISKADSRAITSAEETATPTPGLSETNPELRELMEKIPALCCACRGEHFAYVNSVLEDISGYSEQELLKMKWWEKFTPDFRDLVRERGMARQRGENVPTHYEASIYHKSGQEIWLAFFLSSLDIAGKKYVLVAIL